MSRSDLNPPPLGWRHGTMIRLRPKFGRVSLPPHSLGPREIVAPNSPEVACAIQYFFFAFFSIIFWKANKNTFWHDFWDSWSPWRGCSTILDPKMDPRGLHFRRFFENGDFLKIVLPL